MTEKKKTAKRAQKWNVIYPRVFSFWRRSTVLSRYFFIFRRQFFFEISSSLLRRRVQALYYTYFNVFDERRFDRRLSTNNGENVKKTKITLQLIRIIYYKLYNTV